MKKIRNQEKKNSLAYFFIRLRRRRNFKGFEGLFFRNCGIFLRKVKIFAQFEGGWKICRVICKLGCVDSPHFGW
jgi:hypothetical protein